MADIPIMITADLLVLTKTNVLPELPSELWTLIGEKISSPRHLNALSRVSRKLYDTLTPLLYSHYDAVCAVESESPISLPSHPEYLRSLSVLVKEQGYYRNQDTTAVVPAFIPCLQSLLGTATELKSFSWSDSAEGIFVQYGPSYERLADPPINHCLSALAKLPSLKEVRIRFLALTRKAVSHNCFNEFDLYGLSNLTTLEIYNFYGGWAELSDFRREIINVLSSSPHLKTLGLGIDVTYTAQREPNHEEYRLYFKRLCVEYGQLESKVGPLKLETLRLGRGMYLEERTMPTDDSDAMLYSESNLDKLTDVKYLKTFHIWNDRSPDSDRSLADEPEAGLYKIDWAALNDASNLKRLSVSRITSSFTTWLGTRIGSPIEDLVVTHDYEIGNPALDEWKNIPPEDLKMILSREKSSHSIIHRTGQWGNRQPIEGQENPLSMTILDRLVNRGAQLTRLCLSLDFENQWAKFSTHLPNLKHLTQLRLERPTDNYRIWPNFPLAFDKSVMSLPKTQRREGLARHIAKLSPSLRYIMISQTGPTPAWIITRHRYPADGKMEVFVELETLEKREIMELDLFSLQLFNDDSGLPRGVDEGMLY